MSALGTKTINSVFWVACERFGALFIQFCVTLVLARLLSPEDYGLLGMLALFTAVGTVFVDSGFNQALIRKEYVSDSDYSTVFYTNIILGICIYVLLFLLSPYIALFYNIPKLEALAKTLFMMFPICALGIVQETVLIRACKFKSIALIAFISAIISGFVGIFSALNGYGVWALVYQQLSLYISKNVLLWGVAHWRPHYTFCVKTLKELLNFSLSLLSIGFINNIFNHIYTLIIGKYFAVQEAGFYNQARLLEETPATLVAGVVHRATYPILSQIQEDNDRLKAGYKKIISMTMFVSLPVLAGMLVMADNLFIVFFSEKWLPSVPIFQILCIYGILYPLHVINTNILRVKGEGRLFLVLEIVKKLLMVLGIILTLSHGMLLLIWSSVGASIIAIFLNMYFCGRLINYPVKEQLLDLSKNCVVTILMMFVVWCIGQIPQNVYILFFLQIISGMLSYIALSYFFKLDSFVEYMLIVKNRFHEKKN